MCFAVKCSCEHTSNFKTGTVIKVSSQLMPSVLWALEGTSTGTLLTSKRDYSNKDSLQVVVVSKVVKCHLWSKEEVATTDLTM